VFLRPIGDAVFALVVNLRLRVIRSEMALAADFRLPCHGLREGVAAVTSGARAGRAVEIDAPNPPVGPSLGVEHRSANGILSNRAVRVLNELHRRAMARPAAVDGGEPSLDDFAQNVIERADELRGLGVVTALVFGDDFSVATRARIGSQDRGNDLALVME